MPRATQPASNTATKCAKADQAFAQKAAAGGQAEVELGACAAEGVRPAVKELAAKIEADHQQANTELMSSRDESG